MNDDRLLEGDVLEATVDPEVETLRAEVRRLKRQLEDASVDVQRAREDADRAMTMLRKQLSPLYRALQAVFGELDAAGIADEIPSASVPTLGSSTTAQNSRMTVVWDSWKARLGGSCAKVIDALLVHSDLNTQQVAIATGLHRTTIPGLIHKLHKAGLIVKNNNRFSLKEL